jgi:peptidyl-prolyl cis-trans isomerase D
MLKVFRDNLKYLSWILWVVVGLFIFFIWADFGTLNRRGQGGGIGTTSNVAATVGNQKVSMKEFEASYRHLSSMYEQVYGDQFTTEVARQMGLPQRALNEAVDKKILTAEAEKMGFSVSDEEVRNEILSSPGFQDEKGQFIGEDRYLSLLHNAGLDTASFEDGIRQDILLRKLENAMAAGLYVSDEEVERSYREQVEKAKIRFVQVPRARFQVAGDIPQAEVASYFQAHKQEYRLPEQREAAYLVVDPSQMAAHAPVDDAAVRAYYDNHRDEFTTPDQVRARHILIKTDKRSPEEARKMIDAIQKRLAGGADFAAVAREASEDEGSKATGGDVGYFAHTGQMVKPFEDAAFSAEVGKVVGPVQTQFGFHLIQVTDKRPGGARTFPEVKDQIHNRLATERGTELAQTKAKELAAQIAKDKPGSAADLQAIAQKNPGVSYGTSGKIGRQDPVSGLGFAPAFNNAVFTLQKGQASGVVDTQRGPAIAWLQDIVAPRLPEQAEVEPRVRLALAQQKQQEMVMKQLADARATGKPLADIAKSLGVEVKESSEFGAQGAIPGIGFSPELSRAAMSLPVGQIGGPVADAQGAVLFEVTEHKAWDPIQFAQVREQTREQLRRQKIAELQSSLIERRRKELDIRFDPQALQQFGITESQPSS